MEPKNLLFIMSDEHNPKMMGCAGHEIVQTPNLDRLAARGTRFTSAYTNCPICVPARASFATGRYVHDIGCWDNATAYEGRPEGWGHRLREGGVRVESIGKLHYRNEADPTGFDAQHMAVHIMDGIGQVWGSVRDPLPDAPPGGGGGPLAKAGPGLSEYNRFDIKVAERARDWLAQATRRSEASPWVLFVGFVAPHFPLIVPEEYFDLYPPHTLPLPKLNPADGHARHPWIEARPQNRAGHTTPAERTRNALAAYLGLCSFIDAQVGCLLDMLDETGLAETTRVVYTSDHGDNAGTRGLWGKGNFYEESAGIPLIIAGPDLPRGQVRKTPVSLIDAHPTILEGAGLEGDARLPGASWFDLAGGAEQPERIVFGEYHAIGSPAGGFMIRKGRYKLNYYLGFEPELFDLEADPEEMVNLAGNPAFASVVRDYEQILRAIVDPEAVDARAKADQAALIERFGGREKALQTGTKGETPIPNIYLDE